MRRLLAFLILFPALALAEIPAGVEFQTGDIIFHTSQSRQSPGVQAATGSLLSHVGLVQVGRKKDYSDAWVLEAVQPVKKTKLSEWIGRGWQKHFLLMRYKGGQGEASGGYLSDDQKKKIILEAAGYLGNSYDIFFTFKNNPDAIYCSELVYLAYKAVGIDIGQPVLVGQLNLSEPVMKILIARVTGKTGNGKHPLCKGLEEKRCIDAVMGDQIIPPVTIAQNGNLVGIYDGYWGDPEATLRQLRLSAGYYLPGF